ncbi:hypothetical protein MP638_003563 [Amoeboaphelidium occidentale]|nr:hypothetical protein MP638_003563 [Amoeboaphelidium occidentale]
MVSSLISSPVNSKMELLQIRRRQETLTLRPLQLYRQTRSHLMMCNWLRLTHLQVRYQLLLQQAKRSQRKRRLLALRNERRRKPEVAE